ncbi:LamB/YcsF family protein [Evansella sp. AB-P1]|uniref:LamB/YcsF family protein n=1 Tax=Evansella sp. AB-P1 TaxID=3037653 RepID=UPI00241D92C4|nr:5-oxoprolinase subunit PxpA [Evansella sp. AB-P1]MDG5787446.1 LamB/YcsF family protein [Evansella sp. AB-P1]
MGKLIDLNSDIGESFGAYKIGNDENVLQYITSANIACGYHAGDHNVMHRTVKLATENNVSIGAHPGLPDLMGFGRRMMEVSPSDVYNMVVYQVSALQGFLHIQKEKLHHVKPHGALFNMAATNTDIARSIAMAVKDIDSSLILYGLAGSELIKEGGKVGLSVAQEVFADRTYQPDGTLTPRTHPNGVISNAEQMMNQSLEIVLGGFVTAIDGSKIPIQGDTICVHGDKTESLYFVQQLRATFEEHGVTVTSPVGSRYNENI